MNGLWLDTKQTYTSHGRPLRQTNPDLTYTELRYYNGAADPTQWELDDLGVTTGEGPLAERQAFSSTGTGLPATEYEWSAANRLVATRHGTGVVQRRTFATNGGLLNETISCEWPQNPACAAEGETLRSSLNTYDLRGRLLWERVDDSGANSLFKKSATYDELDRLKTSTVDPGGLSLTTTHHYDGLGRVTKTISPAGRSVCFAYDSLSRVLETRRMATVDLDPLNPACVTSPNNDVVTSSIYDAMDRTVISTDGEGMNTYFWYDAHGRSEFVSDGKPEAPAVVFDQGVFLENPPPTFPTSQWWAETTYNEASQAIRSRFHGRDNIDSGTSDFLSASWTEYDELGRVTDTHVGVSQQGAFVNQSDWTAATPTEISQDTHLSSATTVYDAVGRVLQTIDAGGRVTDYEYDAFSRLLRVLEPVYGTCDDGSDRSCVSDPECAPASCNLNPRDEVKTLFDGFGRPYRTERKTHDHDGTPRTVVSETAYDAWGRVARSTGDPGAEDLLTVFLYDPLGRTEWQIRRWNADGTPSDQDQAITRTFDGGGRLTSVAVRESLSSPGPPAVFSWAPTSFSYDADGLTTLMTDAKGNATAYQYSAGLGRLAQMVYPMEGSKQQTVKYTQYNDRGQPTEIQFRDDDSDSAMRVAWTLDYDDRGRLVRRTGVLEQAVGECADDPQESCTSTEDCENLSLQGPCVLPDFSGTTQQDFTYDDLGRVVKAVDHSSTAEFGSGNEDITIQRAYDSAGQLRTSTQLIPRNGAAVSHTVTSVYNEDGFRRSLIYPAAQNTTPEALESHHIDYLQDSKGRLEWIIGRSIPDAPIEEPGSTWPDRNLARYHYSGGRVTSRWYGNETELTVSTDPLGRVTQLRTTPQSGPDVADFLYGYDRVGNLTHEQRLHEPFTNPANHFRTRTYANDLMGRMTNRSEGPATTSDPLSLASTDDSETWDLDLVGNWESRIADGTTDTFTDNSLNQYTQVNDGSGPDQFVHDWLGQLREDEPRGQKYVWDLFGRLTKVLFETGTLKARYRYDAFNRRVERHVPSPGEAIPDATTWFTYDGWRAIEERGLLSSPATEIVRARYGFGLGLDEVLWMDRDLDASSTVESRFFIHHDMRGSAVAATDDPVDPDEVDVVERYTYSEYGVAQVWTDPTWSGNGYPGVAQSYSDVGLPYLYTGQRYDAESGLSYFKNRYYDADNGRFLRRDLLGYVDGPQLYQYAKSNPAIFTDPLGLMSSEDHEATTTAAGLLLGLPTALIDSLVAVNLRMDWDHDYTAWDPPFFSISNGVAFHGFGPTVLTMDEFMKRARNVQTPWEAGMLLHLVQDDGVNNDGVHGPYGRLGHVGRSIVSLDPRYRDPDKPDGFQRRAAVRRSQVVMRHLALNMYRSGLWDVVGFDPLDWFPPRPRNQQGVGETILRNQEMFQQYHQQLVEEAPYLVNLSIAAAGDPTEQITTTECYTLDPCGCGRACPDNGLDGWNPQKPELPGPNQHGFDPDGPGPIQDPCKYLGPRCSGGGGKSEDVFAGGKNTW